MMSLEWLLAYSLLGFTFLMILITGLSWIHYRRNLTPQEREALVVELTEAELILEMETTGYLENTSSIAIIPTIPLNSAHPSIQS